MNLHLWNEWIKTRRSKLGWFIVLFSAMPVLYALLIYTQVMVRTYNYQGTDAWMLPWGLVVMFYGSVFFPILSGILATTLCRFEHTGGGWKQMFALPISRSTIYLSKLLWLFLLLAIVQITTLGLFMGLGSLLGLQGSPPWSILLTSTFWGWISILPLAALQLWIAFRWKSFVKPMVLHVLIVLPGFLIISSDLRSSLGHWFPWTLPVVGMMEGSFFLAILIYLAVFLGGGLFDFNRREA